MSIKVPKKTSAQLKVTPLGVRNPKLKSHTPETGAAKSPSLHKFLRQRLALSPLDRRGRLKDSTLADEVAARILEDARKGRIEAVRLLIEASESHIVRQKFVNFVIDRIYLIITKHIPDPTSPILNDIAHDLYALKHRVGNHGPKDHIYTDPSELRYEFHEDVDVHASLGKNLPPFFKVVP